MVHEITTISGESELFPVGIVQVQQNRIKTHGTSCYVNGKLGGGGGGGVGFMHSVSLKSHGPVLWPMKLLPFPLNQSCFQSALYKFNKTELRHMVPAVKSVVIDSKALFLKTRK